MAFRFLLAISVSLLSVSSAFSQPVSTDTLWSEKPVYSEVSSQYDKENIVGITIEERFEYFYNTEGDLELKHTLHRRLRLNSDDAINSFNKLSVSLSNVVEVVDIKARVIKPDGKVIEFDRNNIREVTDEESGDNYKIFAIDGIAKGDDIEYLIIRRMTGSNFARAYFQFEYPVQKACFDLTSPENLKYASKGYNGFPDGVQVVLGDKRNRLCCTKEDIPGLKSEEYNYFNPRRARLELKLEYNLSRSKARLLTWNDASQRIYEIMYQGVNQKSVDKWLGLIRVKNGTFLEKAALVEDYIKKNIPIEDIPSPELSDLDFIRTNKVAGEQGVVKLYANLFKALGIKHEIVLTSDRTDIRFDPDFQTWNYLDKYLIFLPEENKYIDPAVNTYRIGCVSGELTATPGLFVELVKIGSFESAVGKIKYIEPAPYNSNYDNMNIDITIDVNKAETRVVDTRGLKGLSGGFIAEVYKNVDDERKLEILKSIMESKATSPVYTTLKAIDKSDIGFISDAEFIIYSDFTTSSLVEIAGNKLLLNIGESIGPQVELYYDQASRRDGESEFNRRYYRNITFTVPEGYKIVNPDAADMNITGKSGEDVPFGFISKHEYSGNTYTVIIDEFYKKIYVTPDEFEGFRNVINAAANFNKVVLILEKK